MKIIKLIGFAVLSLTASLNAVASYKSDIKLVIDSFVVATELIGGVQLNERELRTVRRCVYQSFSYINSNGEASYTNIRTQRLGRVARRAVNGCSRFLRRELGMGEGFHASIVIGIRAKLEAKL